MYLPANDFALPCLFTGICLPEGKQKHTPTPFPKQTQVLVTVLKPNYISGKRQTKRALDERSVYCILLKNHDEIYPLRNKHSTWNWMVGILSRFLWGVALFSGELLVSGSVGGGVKVVQIF